MLDPLFACGEVLLVCVQLLSELAEELERRDAIPGLEPRDVRGRATRKGELPLGEARLDPGIPESPPDRRRVVDVRMVVRCSHREPQSRVKTAASDTSPQAMRAGTDRLSSLYVLSGASPPRRRSGMSPRSTSISRLCKTTKPKISARPRDELAPPFNDDGQGSRGPCAGHVGVVVVHQLDPDLVLAGLELRCLARRRVSRAAVGLAVDDDAPVAAVELVRLPADEGRIELPAADLDLDGDDVSACPCAQQSDRGRGPDECEALVQTGGDCGHASKVARHAALPEVENAAAAPGDHLAVVPYGQVVSKTGGDRVHGRELRLPTLPEARPKKSGPAMQPQPITLPSLFSARL